MAAWSYERGEEVIKRTEMSERYRSQQKIAQLPKSFTKSMSHHYENLLISFERDNHKQ